MTSDPICAVRNRAEVESVKVTSKCSKVTKSIIDQIYGEITVACKILLCPLKVEQRYMVRSSP